MNLKLFAALALPFLFVACAPSTPSASSTLDIPPTASPEPTPTFAPENYGSAAVDVIYCSPDGMPQKLDVYFPDSGGPWPVIFYVHGGAWMEGDKAEGEGWRWLNDQGFLVVSVNYRMAADGKFPVMIEDVKCAVRYLRAHSAEYHLDPDRFGAMGASAGAHLVALLGTADESAGWDEGEYTDQSSQVQAVVSISGIYDLTIKVPSGIGTPIYYAFGSLAGKESPEMMAASPVTYIDTEDPPVLILHGTQDAVLPFEQAELMQAKLMEAGVPSTLVVVENGDHSLNPSFGREVSHTWEDISQIISGFFQETLLD